MEENNSVKDKKTFLDNLIEKIKKSDSIEEILKGSIINYKKTEQQFKTNSLSDYITSLKNGANRFDIVFKAGRDSNLINHYVEKIKLAINSLSAKYIYSENSLTFSIAFDSLENFKKIFLKLLTIEIDSQDILQVNVNETGKTVEQLKPAYYKNIYKILLGSDPDIGGSPFIIYDGESSFWENYNWLNQERYRLIGLTYPVLSEERRDSAPIVGKKKLVKVGILDPSGIIDTSAKQFWKSTKKVTHDDFFLSESVGLHANRVAEVIIGKQGITPYVDLYSSQFEDWNGIAGELNWFINNGVHVINNSWGSVYQNLTAYNADAQWLDNFLLQNSEVVFIKTAGNEGNPLKKGYKKGNEFLEHRSLSFNSIIVGALETQERVKGQAFSEISKNVNYVTTSAPDLFISEFEDEKGLHAIGGTSFAAPSITGIVALLKQPKYQAKLNQGKDSIIIKSAIISGSRNNLDDYLWNNQEKSVWNHNYNNKTGFGRANYSKIQESLNNLEYFRLTSRYTEDNKYVKKVYIDKGKKYRVNITWQVRDLLHRFPIDKSVWLYNVPTPDDTFTPPVSISLNVRFPGNSGKVVSVDNNLWNTKIVDFEATESGYYSFEVFYNSILKDPRLKDYDVAMTYSQF
ncbi:S8 family serine peptidase [Mycoplasmopsis agassizii]|nr:S8 family serine peptidase [Mycoplasmopsis agassizii]